MTAAVEVRDARFADLVSSDATIERVAAGFRFTEGPVWRGDHLLFVDVVGNRIIHWRQSPEGPEVRTFRAPSNGANALTLDARSRLVICESGSRAVTRIETDGRAALLADRYQGKRLNSPNDLVVRPDGTIYFTDPTYGLRNGTEGKELPFQGLYRVKPDGVIDLLADDFAMPNGIALSPDQGRLYVGDTDRRHIRAFDVHPDGRMAGGRVFAELDSSEEGWTDGMKIDCRGNVYCTGPGGVWVFCPRGQLLGRIVPPEPPANLAWGDGDWKTLFITACASLYRIRVNVPGIPVPLGPVASRT